MGALFIILPHHMIGEKRLATSRGTEYELVAVGNDTAFHRQVGNVQMDRFSRQPVCHLDAEWRWGIMVIGFLGEETQCRFNKGVKAFLAWKISCIAGHTRPVQRRRISSIVPWLAFHKGQCATAVVFQLFKFRRVIRPCHDIEVCAD
ncbi:hypothetical protein D3C87_1540380 [compost metagenome]